MFFLLLQLALVLAVGLGSGLGVLAEDAKKDSVAAADSSKNKESKVKKRKGNFFSPPLSGSVLSLFPFCQSVYVYFLSFFVPVYLYIQFTFFSSRVV